MTELRENPQDLVIVTTIRVLLIVLACAWGCYMLLVCRTQQFGMHVGSALLACGLFVLPAAALLGFRRNWKKWFLSALLICGVCLIVSETVAGIEEHLFKSRVESASITHKAVSQKRWWPCGHHGIYFEPESQKFGAHD